MLLACLLLVFVTQQGPTCKDVEVCRAQALIAHAAGDHEAFHDLAWAAYRKGRPNDPELMLLVARAQSLSGRPGDALVMLERVAALGAPTDATTSEDFAKVRALPRWADVEAKLAAAATAAPGAKPSAAPPAKPAAATKDPAPPAAAPASPPAAATPTTPSPAASPTAPPAPTPPAPARAASAPLRFTTLLTPTALAYDGVSKRFIIADRSARRIAVVDEHSGQVSTLMGGQGSLGEIGGIGIDTAQGDLWAVSSTGGVPTLHKVQLISGRVLSTTPLKGLQDAVVGVTFVRGAGLIAADARGNLWRVSASGRAEKIGALEYVPRALASDAKGTLYVAAGGPRLGVFAVATSLRRTGVVELEDGIPADVPFAVHGDRLHVVLKGESEYEIRSMKIK